MIADAAVPGGVWTAVGAVVVFVAALAALAVDRSRMKRRLARLERSEALLETDLATARREVDALRDCLRDRPENVTAGEVASGPGDPAARG